MKTLSAFIPLLVLAACTRQPVEPVGVYKLATAETMMVLELRASGDYILHIDGPGSMTDEIRGRWEDERGKGPHLSLHGLDWRGTVPEAGSGIWTTVLQSNADLCLDVSGSACFIKDAAA